eukprot:387050-Lingulodinium_polyedra.AAC.1
MSLPALPSNCFVTSSSQARPHAPFLSWIAAEVQVGNLFSMARKADCSATRRSACRDLPAFA